MGSCLSRPPAEVDVPVESPPNQVLRYSQIRQVRRLADLACQLYEADGACIVLSSTNNAVITDSKHEQPNWIECWQQVLEDLQYDDSGTCWLQYDPPNTNSGLTVSWVAAAQLPGDMGVILVKGSTPAVPCAVNLARFAGLVRNEFMDRSQDALVAVNTAAPSWPILWVNQSWAALTEVSAGSLWKYFEKGGDVNGTITLAPNHRPKLKMHLYLDRLMTPNSCVVGRLISKKRGSLDQAPSTELFDTVPVFEARPDSEQPEKAFWGDTDVRLIRFKCKMDVVAGIDLHALKKMEHKNLLKYYASEVRLLGSKVEVWVLAEYVEGQTMNTMLNTNSFDVLQSKITHAPDFFRIFKVAAQVADGLKSLHKNGLQHGHLSPSNILITEDRCVKITLYGLASVFPVDRSYAAPEQVQGGASVLKSDQYSFGVILHEMLTGKPLRQGLRDSSNFPIDTPRSISSLVDQCVAYHSSDRPNWSSILNSLHTMMEGSLLS